MLRILNSILAVVICILSVFLYQLKYESRQLDKRAKDVTQKISEERDTIAVLRAEWSLLIRPERVEKLAQQHLGLKTLNAKQVVTEDFLKQHFSQNTQLKDDDIEDEISLGVHQIIKP
ncbi:MAG: cell division protein FtsL [Pseudomonadota bacterium]